MKSIDSRLDALYGLASQAIEYHARDVNEPNDARFQSMIDEIMETLRGLPWQEPASAEKLARTRRALADLGLIEYD